METIIRAILDSRHEDKLKLALISEVCKRSSQALDAEAASLWCMAIATSINGPTPSHRIGSGALIQHLRKSHMIHRNEALCTVLNAFVDADIELTLAQHMISAISSSIIDSSPKTCEGLGIFAPYRLLEWFLTLCLKFENDWTQSDQIKIASIWIAEDMLRRFGGATDLASRLINAGLTWIVSQPNGNVGSSPLIAAVLTLSQGDFHMVKKSRHEFFTILHEHFF